MLNDPISRDKTSSWMWSQASKLCKYIRYKTDISSSFLPISPSSLPSIASTYIEHTHKHIHLHLIFISSPIPHFLIPIESHTCTAPPSSLHKPSFFVLTHAALPPFSHRPVILDRLRDSSLHRRLLYWEETYSRLVAQSCSWLPFRLLRPCDSGTKAH